MSPRPQTILPALPVVPVPAEVIHRAALADECAPGTSDEECHTPLRREALAAAAARHERMMTEARRIIDTGNARGVVLRLTGGLAVRHYAIDLDFTEREYSDIDLVGLRRQAGDIHALFGELGYAENVHVAQATDGSQRQFVLPPATSPKRRMSPRRGPRANPVLLLQPPHDHIDVFLDAMKMDHVLEMRERLHIGTYAITPADLFLSKLQIGRLDEKDVHDVVTLCKDVYVDFEDHPGTLNLQYVADTCAADWGLYVDVMTNLDTVLERLDQYDLSVRQFTRVRRTLELAQAMMSDATKSLRWRLRARIGRRLPWRREVEETLAREAEGPTVAVRTKEGRAAV